MDFLKPVVGLVGTVAIAGWVAYSVSAPRNVDNAMNQPMEALDGKSINQTMADEKARVRSEQCERFTDMASDAWDKAVDRGTLDRDADRLAQMQKEADRFCK